MYCALRNAQKIGILGVTWNIGRKFMKTKMVAKSLKNAVSTVFLLAGAFFVCSTFLSMRAVFADPIAPVIDPSLMAPQAQRAGNNARTSGRASPRNKQTKNRTTVARSTIIDAARAQQAQRSANPTRNVVSRAAAQNPRATAVSSRATKAATPTRNVVSRQNAAVKRAGANTTRTVRARTTTKDAATNARISLQGSAIRGSKVNTSGSTYSYLNTKLYTGNYSNIIDSSTGMISADAYSNCMESYYTCMDEICTARNQAQRRCGCAGRVKAFAEAETALETANEELIKVSGELALLIANKGKDVSEAFQLTDAEKVMNCVSWQEASKSGTWTADEAKEWCHEHGMYDTSKCSQTQKPSYCDKGGNNFGFDIDNLDGNSSDILASLKSWADAKDNTITILSDDTDNILSAFENVSNVVGNLAGIGGAFNNTEASADTLATTWGYDLFEYAHDNICSRVLDSCFNGIYEGCGTPPNGGKCANGQTSNCPFNYNSNVEVSSDGNVEVYERGKTGLSNSSATCFGYTTTSGDPYSDLRGPVADARRSIINKYLLDANADCDLYGEQLRVTAQNIGYQKVAAQQALQQKRLEFAVEEKQTVLANAHTAMSNFNECLSEIYECYTETSENEDNWPTSRIKTYCSQVANIPHCYEEMICTPSMAQFNAVIDEADNKECKNTQDYSTNTCRNVITLNEILNGTGASAEEVSKIEDSIQNGSLFGTESKQNSLAIREHCLQKAMGIKNGQETEWDIRGWQKPKNEKN